MRSVSLALVLIECGVGKRKGIAYVLKAIVAIYGIGLHFVKKNCVFLHEFLVLQEKVTAHLLQSLMLCPQIL